MLRAQPSHQLAEHHSQIACQQLEVGLSGHAETLTHRVTDQFACIILQVIASLASRRATQSKSTASERYRWIALSNVTLGVLLATLDASITLIAMPDIFRGIHLDPLQPANSFYLLWMILGFLVVSSVLIVSLGRLGDMYGRVRITTSASSSTRSPPCC